MSSQERHDLFREAAENATRHGTSLWKAIDRVGGRDRKLSEELSEEYYGLLKALLEALDQMVKSLEH